MAHGVHTHRHTHTHTILRPSWIFSRSIRISQYQKGKTRKVKPISTYWSKRQQVAVASAGPRHITTHASHHSLFTGQMPFLPPNQQQEKNIYSTSFDWRLVPLISCILLKKRRLVSAQEFLTVNVPVISSIEPRHDCSCDSNNPASSISKQTTNYSCQQWDSLVTAIKLQ